VAADPSQISSWLSHPELPNFGADAAAAVAGNTSLLKLNQRNRIRPQDLSGPGGLALPQPTVLISGAGIAGPHWLLAEQEWFRVTDRLKLADGVRPGGQTVGFAVVRRDVVGDGSASRDAGSLARSARLGLDQI